MNNGDMMGYITHCKELDMDVSANFWGNSSEFMAISNGIIMMTKYYHLMVTIYDYHNYDYHILPDITIIDSPSK